ncbi:hypothetical protein EW145_g2635 [Phellinidium pouzarii]|uniref:FH2 domain-containing protein n=1 Tax=Phellinidium pouzarii TaxID=167371 RepID=A0A4V3XD61_9AGAM|nr:hypothetical protein EW145_g2635 [Phellinidium pouzarii]
MDTLFGRKKPRPRQTSTSADLSEHSIPYDRLGPASKSPIPVGTVSQGLRTSVTNSSVISAPITNPTLTSDGTELNYHAMQRSRSDRERLYPQSSRSLAKSPLVSASSSSATVSSEASTASTSSSSSITVANSSHVRRSEAFAGRRSPSMSDFGNLSPTSPPLTYNNLSNAPVRPSSVVSTHSENNRVSKYAVSLAASDSVQSHYSHASHIFHHGHKGIQDDFEFERPSDDTVQILFEQVRLRRDLGELPSLSADRKWQIVYNDEQLRWKEEKDREEMTKRQSDTGQTPTTYLKDSPEWYLKKFLDQTITPKQAASLLVSLRTALEALSTANNESGPYVYWFHSLESILLGRGKMGSLVGASEEIRKNAGMDSSLNEYAQANLLVIHGVLDHIDDLDLRIHHRTQMEGAGLRRIMAICREFGYPQIERQLDLIDNLIDADERALRDVLDQEILRDYSNPQDVYSAIVAKTQGSKALDYFLSAMQHLLLIHEEGPALNHYYQIIDSAVTDIVLDRKLNGAESKLGTSVQRIIAQLNEAEQYQHVEEQANEARGWALQLKIEKETLEEEISRGSDGLVGQLKAKVSQLEGKLNGSRGTIDLLQGQLEEQKRGYEEQIVQLEAQILELFRMLRELGRGVEEIVDRSQSMDRKDLMATLEKQLQRSKTISLLEGRRESTRRRTKAAGVDGLGGPDEVDGVSSSLSLKRGSKSHGRGKKQATHPDASGIRDSQFADADEASVQEHIEKRIAAAVFALQYPQRDGTISSPRNARNSPWRGNTSRLPLYGDSTSQNVPSDASGLLIPGPTDDYENGHKRDSRVPSEDKDSESEYRQSTKSGFTNYTEDTQATSVGSRRSAELSQSVSEAHSLAHENQSDNQLSLAQVFANKMTGLGNGPTTSSGNDAAVLPNHESTADDESHVPPPPPPPPPSTPGPPPPPPPPPPPVGVFGSTPAFSAPVPPPPTPLSAPPSTPGFAHPSMYLGMNLNNLIMARKDIAITPNTKMKQLQWDKLPQTQVGRTLWNDEEPDKEKEWIKMLREERIWEEMEEDFKAKQLVINLMAKQRKAELRSVLDPQTKKRVEILIQRVKSLQPEEIAFKIESFDKELCTETFLGELKKLLPTPEQVGKLNIYRNADAEELSGLHPSDRLMVKLIQIERLGPRIEAMLYKITFTDTRTLLDEGARKLIEAGEGLLRASRFKELLSLILLIGNYMNGTGIKGGAFGFRISSINKLVDTKSLNNTTLLHFLEKTIAHHFPDMAEFLNELEKPAEAYRVNLQDVRKGFVELRDGLKKIKSDLDEHFSNMDLSNSFISQMWTFVGKASSRLDDLKDNVNLADSTFKQAVSYYGEEERGMTSSEFYGIFKTFVTSYKKCQMDNRSAQEERNAAERRRKAAEESKANRSMKNTEGNSLETGDNAVLDTLLEKLRNGDSVGRKSRRSRRTNGKTAVPLRINVDANDTITTGAHADVPAAEDKTVDLARDMLAALKSDGFEAFNPTFSNRTERSVRRTKRHRVTEFGAEEMIASPTFSDDKESGVEQDEMREDQLESSFHRASCKDGVDGVVYDEDGDMTVR